MAHRPITMNRAFALLLLLSYAFAAEGEPVTRLLDIRAAGAERVVELKGAEGVDWWLELGDGLLVTGERRLLDRLNAPIAYAWPGLDPATLVLQARGCGIDSRLQQPSIAQAGRFALVRMPAALAHYPGRRSERLPVTINTSYARLWSNDPAKARTTTTVDPLLQPLVDAVDPARWLQRLTTLAGYDRNTLGAGRIQARDWLVGELQAMGSFSSVTTPGFSFYFPPQQRTAENVLAFLPGTRTPDRWVIVGGHYDSRNADLGSTVNAPGAEDNASGCAGVLELAEVLSRYRPEYSVLFVCYAAEEQGLYGSEAHANDLQLAGYVSRVVYMLNMDMIGYSADADLDVLIESTALGQPSFARFGALAAAYAPGLRLVTSLGACCADHVPYLDRGIPAALTAANDCDSYPHYHQSTDIPANITNALAMGGNLLRMNAAFLGETAKASDRPFMDGFE